MKYSISLLVITLMLSTTLYGKVPVSFNTQWISSKPEVMTYSSTSKQGDGLYQVSISKRDSTVEIYINMITPGFTKTVCATMTLDMRPLQSTAKIIINNQIVMDTKCFYVAGKLMVSTTMMPYNRIITDTLAFTDPVIDFSQIPLLVRTLDLSEASEYSFTSLNPNTNQLVPLTIKVVGHEPIKNIDCYKVEQNDFEGKSIYWVEKGAGHRVMLVEQQGTSRTTELLP